MTRRARNGLRDRWIACVLRARIDGETRALLLFVALHMTDAGRFSGPTREDLALMFDVPERRIAERFQRAQEAGLLCRVGGGYNYRPAIWTAVIPTEKAVS